MTNKIGIDAGGSLIKVAYEEQQKLHVKTYSNREVKALIQWLQLLNPNATLHLTGGKRSQIQSESKQRIVIVDEFDAIIRGTKFLLQREKPGWREDFILVNIGTGTSIFHVTENHSERLLGSGVGGGTFIGLGSVLSGRNDFQHLIKLAANGSSHQSDLLVRDIYAPDEPPISGDLTASNFGKAHMNRYARVEDHLAALIRMIGETIATLATLAKKQSGTENIVFVGSTLVGNEPLKTIFRDFRKLVDYNPIFLEKGAYAGAIGTLM